MGVLSWPRLYFNGYNYWNPSTVNNNDYAPQLPTYDMDPDQPNWTFLHSQGVESGDQFSRWLITPTLYLNNDSSQPEQLVTDPKPVTLPPAEWSYYGGNQCGFVTADAPQVAPPFYKPSALTQVTGYTNSAGQLVQSGDPWLALPLQFNQDGDSAAKLVDVNPQSFWSSQIFADSFALGGAGLGFSAPVAQRLHARWQHKPHNYNVDGGLMIAGQFSTVFQTCFAKDAIAFAAGGSQIGAELQQALAAPDVSGLMLRFVSYDTLYFQGSIFEGDPVNPEADPDKRYLRMTQLAELYRQYTEELAAYKAGRRATAPTRPINRAYSRMVGWIGLWKQGELISAPGGRVLLGLVQAGQQVPPALAPRKVQARDLPQDWYASTSNHAAVALGTAFAEVQTAGDQVERITVDLGAAIPGYQSNSDAKAAFGQIQLALGLPDGQGGVTVTPIANLADDGDGAAYGARYIQTAGVIDIAADQLLVPLTAAQIGSSPLLVTVESYTPDGQGGWSSQRLVGLTENALNAQTDQRGLYVDQPGAPNSPAYQTSTIQVRNYGQAPEPGTLLVIAQYDEGWNLIGDPKDAMVRLSVVESGGALTPIANTTLIAATGGEVTLAVEALQPGVPNLAFFPLPPGTGSFTPPPAGLGPLLVLPYFTIARVLPFHNHLVDEFGQLLAGDPTPDLDLVNQWIFDKVYRSFFQMYPVMDFIHSPLKFQEWRGKIKEVTDLALLESARYMPVMRTLSAGQRAVIERYCAFADQAPTEASNRRLQPSSKLGHV
jgi:hypothetical protein